MGQICNPQPVLLVINFHLSLYTTLQKISIRKETYFSAWHISHHSPNHWILMEKTLDSWQKYNHREVGHMSWFNSSENQPLMSWTIPPHGEGINWTVSSFLSCFIFIFSFFIKKIKKFETPNKTIQNNFNQFLTITLIEETWVRWLRFHLHF